jgi:hypothetical protein
MTGKGDPMRSIAIAIMIAAGIGLAGTSGTAAASPAGAALRDAAHAVSLVATARCAQTIRYRFRICHWAACGIPQPPLYRSRCGYRCPGIEGLVWRGWC